MFNYEVPTSSSAAPPLSNLKLAAHTNTANLLAQRLFDHTINQDVYEAHIYSTSIASTDRERPIPIILTLGESLDTIIAFAKRRFNVPAAALVVSRLYVVWSTETLQIMGEHAFPNNVVLLHNDNLEMVLRTMKTSLYAEQLLVEFTDPVPPATAAVDLLAIAESHYRHPAPFEEPSISQKGKEPGSSSSFAYKPLNPLEAYDESPDGVMDTNLRRKRRPGK